MRIAGWCAIHALLASFSILGVAYAPSTLFIRYSRRALALFPADPMHVAELLTRIAAELALFAGVGFLLFGLNDLPST